MTNAYEADARDRKAARLATVFFDHARDACFKVDMANNVKPRGGDDCAASIIIMANKAPMATWLEVAKANGINPPSPLCVELAKVKVVKRCKAIIQGPTDPFAGLPGNN